MSQTRICLNLRRPDDTNFNRQGKRGPFAPIIMALRTLVLINLWQLRQRKYPKLYRSGIYYKTKPPAVEWHDIPTLLYWGYGDCKDLVAYRVAELNYQGIPAQPCIKWKYVDIEDMADDSEYIANLIKAGITQVLLIHVMVLMPDGSIEDPSKILGMGGEYS